MKSSNVVLSISVSLALVFSFTLIVFADDVSTTVDVGNAAPSVSSVSFNNSSAITLTENTTTTVYATSTVSDANGCGTITSVNADFYRSGVTAVSCDDNAEDNNNNCYAINSCTVVTSGNTCDGGTDTSADYVCSVSLQYYADPTDSGTYSAQDWEVTVTVDDGTATGTNTDNAEVNSLTSLDVTASIDYGTLSANSDTGAVNSTTTVTNTGNIDMDPEVSGTNMTSGGDTILVGNQEYSATSFTYGAGTSLTGSGVGVTLTLPQPTSGTAPVTDDVLWGLGVDNGQPVGTYTGTNTFTAAAGL